MKKAIQIPVFLSSMNLMCLETANLTPQAPNCTAASPK